jgi:hypothetical protein
LDNIKTPTTLAPTKTSKKSLKKSSLKGLKVIKKKATEAIRPMEDTKAAKPTEEDTIAIF